MLLTARLKSCKKYPDLDVILAALSYLRHPSHIHFCAFSLFVAENSGIFQGEGESQLTPADHVLRLRHTVKTQNETGLVKY